MCVNNESNILSKSNRLRMLLERPNITLVAGAFDGLSARIAEDAGFDAIWVSGFSVAASHAVPDAGILTMTDMLDISRIINCVVNCPVIVDCDIGFGDINNIIHTVHYFESSGIAGICIEDKIFPKRNSHSAEPQLLCSIDVFSDKLRAAIATRRDPNFLVIGRIEGLIAGESISTTLLRANAYVNAGADAILINSRSHDHREIAEFASRWHGRTPLIALPTSFPTVTVQELECMGFRMCIYANQIIRSIVDPMRDVCKKLVATGCAATVQDTIVSMAELFALQSPGFQVSAESATSVGHFPTT